LLAAIGLQIRTSSSALKTEIGSQLNSVDGKVDGLIDRMGGVRDVSVALNRSSMQ